MSGNIGPLTSTFTPASTECLSSLHFARESGKTGINLGFPGTSRSTCLPSSFDWPASSYYSPGLCPSGYNYACSLTATNDDGLLTVATCCPGSWDCRPDRASDMQLACVTTFPAQTELSMGSFSMNSPTIVTGSTTMTIAPGMHAYAFGIIVQRASTDPAWPGVTTASTSPTQSAISESSWLTPGASTVATVSGTTSAASSDAHQDSSSGLSTGAKAGIGVGVGVGGLLLLAIGTFVLRKRKRRQDEATGSGAAPSQEKKPPKELDGTMLQELAADNKGESQGKPAAQGRPAPAELPGE